MSPRLKMIAMICLAAAWMVAAEAALATTDTRESRDVELFYSELNDDSLKPKRCEDTSLVGNTQCVAENIDPGADETRTTSAEASLGLTLTAYLQILEADNSHIVRLKVRGGRPVILGRMKAQSQNDVWADATLVKRRLRAWRLSLSAAQIEALYRDGTFTVQVRRPFEGLKKLVALDTPVSLTVTMTVRCPEAPDLTALMTLAATKRKEAYRRLRENFRADRGASCPSQSGRKRILLPATRSAFNFSAAFARLRASLVPSATAQEREPAKKPRAEVAADTGPFAGRKFGQFKSENTFPFRNREKIREIQAEMTRNGGRDETLQQNGWDKFEADVARTIEALNRYTDTMESRSYLSISIEGIRNTQDALSDRRVELEGLRDEVIGRLRDPKFIEFLKVLETRISQSRARNPHDMQLALNGIAVGNLIRILVSGAAAASPITLPFTIVCLGYNLFTIVDIWEKDRIIKRRSRPYLELMDMTANLTLLIEQYNIRMEAQAELLSKLNVAWHEAKKRHQGCKK